MVKIKIQVSVRRGFNFADFFPENFVCLPFSFSPLGPNASEKGSIESVETGQNGKPSQISNAQNHDTCRIAPSVSKSANLKRGRAF